MGAIAVSNSVDRLQCEKREAQYMQIVKKYDKDEANEISHMFAMTVIEMENSPRDVLGETYMELEMGNDRTGQFFTPYHLSVMMAKMTFGDGLADEIDKKGFITLSEPACGAGGMVIAIAEELQHKQINYQQALHVTAVDIDPICVHMSYLQFSLLHIPAIVVHGDTLKLEEWNRWYTPAHIMGGWDWRLNSRHAIESIGEILARVEPFSENVVDLIAPETAHVPVQIKTPVPSGRGQQLNLF